jgi:hypothetical protein
VVPNEGQENGDANTPGRLRQLWSSWLTTPFSSASEKDAFLVSNGVTTPMNHPASASDQQQQQQHQYGTLSAAIPAHVYGPCGGVGAGGKGALSTPQQYQYALQKSMSLPSIKSPLHEHRWLGNGGGGPDAATPRVPGYPYV